MTSWRSFEIATDADAAPMIVFATAAGLRSPTAMQERVGAGIRTAGFESKPGRWLDLVGSGAAAERLVVIALADEDAEDRWRNLGGHIVEVMRAMSARFRRHRQLINIQFCLIKLVRIQGAILRSR